MSSCSGLAALDDMLFAICSVLVFVSVLKKSEKSLIKVSISRFQKFESRSQSWTWDQGRKSLGIGLDSVNPVSLITETTIPPHPRLQRVSHIVSCVNRFCIYPASCNPILIRTKKKKMESHQQESQSRTQQPMSKGKGVPGANLSGMNYYFVQWVYIITNTKIITHYCISKRHDIFA